MTESEFSTDIDRSDEQPCKDITKELLAESIKKKNFTFDNHMVKPIGFLKTCFKTKNGTPRQGSLSSFSRGKLTIEKSVFNNPSHSLMGIGKYSHIWVLFVFNQSISKTLKAKVAPPRLDGDKVGVYACRSPHRPNFIGLTLATLEKAEGDSLYLSGLDILDGTPVIDIKPYIPSYDCPMGFDYNHCTISRTEEQSSTNCRIMEEHLEKGIEHQGKGLLGVESTISKNLQKVTPELNCGCLKIECNTCDISNINETIVEDDPSIPQHSRCLSLSESVKCSTVQVGYPVYESKQSLLRGNKIKICEEAKVPQYINLNDNESALSMNSTECTPVFNLKGIEFNREQTVLVSNSAHCHENVDKLIEGNGSNITIEECILENCIDTDGVTNCSDGINSSNLKNVTTAQWIRRPPINVLCVLFNPIAKKEILKFSQNPQHSDYRLQFVSNECELRKLIEAILSEDPRSSYRRKKCKDRLYYFTIDTVHITAFFDKDTVEVLRVSPAHLVDF